MEEITELRAMWEFPATWKLVNLLSRPLSFSAPSPSQLENALLNPRENLTTIANIHGRLLRLSAGASSAKNWMQYTARFVRNRPDDFTFLNTEEPQSEALQSEPSDTDMKEEPAEEAGDQKDGANTVKSVGIPDTLKPFPTEEETYFRFRASTRLLVMYTIVEIVLAEHDSLLHAGSIADLDLVELRQYPVGTDAVGNRYWYFGDRERVYREPGKKTFKTRRQKADDEAKAAKQAAKAAAAKAAMLAKEEKRKEADLKREETKRRRDERKRKSMEKWGPRVAATRTTRASSRAEGHLLNDDGVGPSSASAGSSDKKEAMEIDFNAAGQAGKEEEEDAATQRSSVKRKSSAMNVERRTSGRQRKPPHSEPAGTPVRTPKRPRRNDRFVDPELRMCETWELISTGSDGLKELIDRFRAESGGVLSSEKALVRFLEEEVLPEILEIEEKARKEQERQERKLRNELLFSVHKRSSRVQALEQKREEEARKVAEEEERERVRLQEMAERAEHVKAQVTGLQKEQSREIRVARRAHGRTEAIERDDLAHNAMDRKVAKRESHIEQSRVRRSTRALRGSRRTPELDNVPSPAVEDITGAGDVSEDKLDGSETRESKDKDVLTSDGPSHVNSSSVPGNGSGVIDKDQPDAIEEGKGYHETDRESIDKHTVGYAVAMRERSFENGKDVGVGSAGRNEDLSIGRSEGNVGDDYTWSINPDDKEPIRVLDEFFFASMADFTDAPLETCDTKQWHIIGFGVLLPPLESTADARLVEIDRVEDWSIEYGTEPKLWVKSKHAWYELRDPSVEYHDAYVSTRRKYELCIRIAILGATYKPAELTYEVVVDLLSYRYEEMLSYTTSDILEEKRFIVSQMESLGKRPMLQSGFMRELRKKIKAEDLKATGESRKLKTAQERDDSELANELKTTRPVNGPNRVGEQTKNGQAKPTKARTKRRLSSSGRPVPRAVSSIISSVLRAATKSKAPVRKRKRKQDVVNDKVVSKTKQTAKPGKLNGLHAQGPATVYQTIPLDSVQSTQGSAAALVKDMSLPDTRGRPAGELPPVSTPAHLANGNTMVSFSATQLQPKQTATIQQKVNLLAGTDATITRPKCPPQKLENVSVPTTAPMQARVAIATPVSTVESQLVSKTSVAVGNANMPCHKDDNRGTVPLPATDGHKHPEENGVVHGGMNGIAGHVNKAAK